MNPDHEAVLKSILESILKQQPGNDTQTDTQKVAAILADPWR